MKYAVCALVFNQEGKILGVSRKDSPNDWGLPGGKVEEGEILIEALTRELLEETGLEAISTELIFLREDREWIVATFAVEAQGVLHTEERCRDIDEGIVKWITWDELEAGSFGHYNRKLKEFNKVYTLIPDDYRFYQEYVYYYNDQL